MGPIKQEELTAEHAELAEVSPELSVLSVLSVLSGEFCLLSNRHDR
jgi:hypothetical protein